MMRPKIKRALRSGVVIPACPLALTVRRKLDERRQRALLRYYAAAGAGGVAIGVHTTQFAIRDPRHGLFEPLLTLAAEELGRLDAARRAPLARIGGVCGATPQAVREAGLLRQLGFDAGLLSLGALRNATESKLIEHCRRVGEILPVIGFYLQPAVGGRILPLSFWRRFLEIEAVMAIKIAPFNRYQTLDVVRAVAESGRDDVALYTGNDDNIVLDLVTPFSFKVGRRIVTRRIVGGLLGHWAVWTRKAVELLDECHRFACQPAVEEHTETASSPQPSPPGEQRKRQRVGFLAARPHPAGSHLSSRERLLENLLRRAVEVTDCNAAFFDAANDYAGCIAGLHEVLRRQGLFAGLWCLDPNEGLSPGQRREIHRVWAAYPHLNDDAFVARHRDEWLR